MSTFNWKLVNSTIKAAQTTKATNSTSPTYSASKTAKAYHTHRKALLIYWIHITTSCDQITPNSRRFRIIPSLLKDETSITGKSLSTGEIVGKSFEFKSHHSNRTALFSPIATAHRNSTILSSSKYWSESSIRRLHKKLTL